VIAYERLWSHHVIIGSTGTGKTTLPLRLWVAFMAGGLQRHADGLGRRPLLVVLDCKGGESSRETALRARQVLDWASGDYLMGCAVAELRGVLLGAMNSRVRGSGIAAPDLRSAR
jgi:hypothetical protein